jgi:hypothetical protein
MVAIGKMITVFDDQDRILIFQKIIPRGGRNSESVASPANLMEPNWKLWQPASERSNQQANQNQ